MPRPPSLRDLEREAARRPSLREGTEFLHASLKDDPRRTARALLERFERRLRDEEGEQARLEKLLAFEKEARQKGAKAIAGLDEAGRGPLVGPVVAAAVILPEDDGVLGHLRGLDDSKKLTAETRERLFGEIGSRAVAWACGEASSREIDELNIYRASQLAMERAVEALSLRPDHLLLDAMRLPRFSDIPQTKIVHGDSLSASVAAASVMAKVTRDRQMAGLDRLYPQYGIAKHKGYGTREHLEALRWHGPCPEHRRTFGPVAAVLGGVPKDAGLSYWMEEIGKASDITALEETGRRIKTVGRKKLEPEEVASLRRAYRERRLALRGPATPG